MLGKANRGDDGNFAAGELILKGKRLVRLVLLGHHAEDAAEVVGVGVGDDHGPDGVLAQILFNQLHGRLAAFHAHQRVKDDPARVALDDGEVRHVVAAHLIDALADLKQAVGMVVSRVFPQAGVHAVRRFLVFIQKGVGRLAPDDASVLIHELQRLRSGDQAARRKFIFLLVIEIELVIDRGIRCRRKFRGGLDPSGQSEACALRQRDNGAAQQHRCKKNGCNSLHKTRSSMVYCSRMTGGCHASSATMSGR